MWNIMKGVYKGRRGGLVDLGCQQTQLAKLSTQWMLETAQIILGAIVEVISSLTSYATLLMPPKAPKRLFWWPFIA